MRRNKSVLCSKTRNLAKLKTSRTKLMYLKTCQLMCSSALKYMFYVSYFVVSAVFILLCRWKKLLFQSKIQQQHKHWAVDAEVDVGSLKGIYSLQREGVEAQALGWKREKRWRKWIISTVIVWSKTSRACVVNDLLVHFSSVLFWQSNKSPVSCHRTNNSLSIRA